MMASVTPLKTSAELALIAEGRAIPSDRYASFERFAEFGLPHRRIEAYHYTDLRALLKDAPARANRSDKVIAPTVFAALDATRFTLVNGRLVSEDASGLAGVSISTTTDAQDDGLASNSPFPSRGDPVIALNAAFVEETLIITVADKTTLEKPLHVRFIHAERASTYARVILKIGTGADVTLLETHEGAESGVANSVLEVVLSDHAKLEHIRVNHAAPSASLLTSLGGRMGKECTLTSGNFVTGSSLGRHQVFLRFEGEGSNALLTGASLLKDRQHADTTLVVDHAVPECMSREHFAHVLDGEATGVFQGKIIVRPHAQKTDGKMMSRAVLLNDDAVMNNKPELEIFADDVQCGHGATVGALDDDLLFYLRARGLPKKEAEALMLKAFVGEAFESLHHESVKVEIEVMTDAWLNARG